MREEREEGVVATLDAMDVACCRAMGVRIGSALGMTRVWDGMVSR